MEQKVIEVRRLAVELKMKPKCRNAHHTHISSITIQNLDQMCKTNVRQENKQQRKHPTSEASGQICFKSTNLLIASCAMRSLCSCIHICLLVSSDRAFLTFQNILSAHENVLYVTLLSCHTSYCQCFIKLNISKCIPAQQCTLPIISTITFRIELYHNNRQSDNCAEKLS